MSSEFGGAYGSQVTEEQTDALRKATRLQWVSVIVQVLTVGLMIVVAGQSQAMKAAWIEDALAILPPAAFLIAARVAKRPASPEYPYGHFRSVGIAHLVAGVALLGMGLLLVVESASSLLSREKPPIGLVILFGHAVWAGWLMIAVMFVTIFPPMILARMKLKLAPVLHDKVLYADADMNKANWDTGLGTIVGILGIGFGLWWADSAVAALIALSIIRDGYSNLTAAVGGLMDKRATTVDQKFLPLLTSLDDAVAEFPWVLEHVSRVRDQGHVLQCETFVVPRSGSAVSIADLAALRSRIRALDWKLHDVSVIPVEELPAHLVRSDA